MDKCEECPHWVGRHDPDYGSCDSCPCVNRSLIEPEMSEMEGLVHIRAVRPDGAVLVKLMVDPRMLMGIAAHMPDDLATARGEVLLQRQDERGEWVTEMTYRDGHPVEPSDDDKLAWLRDNTDQSSMDFDT